MATIRLCSWESHSETEPPRCSGKKLRPFHFHCPVCKVFPILKNPKNPDPSYKTDLDCSDCLGREKSVLYLNFAKRPCRQKYVEKWKLTSNLFLNKFKSYDELLSQGL